MITLADEKISFLGFIDVGDAAAAAKVLSDQKRRGR